VKALRGLFASQCFRQVTIQAYGEILAEMGEAVLAYLSRYTTASPSPMHV
jgi:hypothetical protein